MWFRLVVLVWFRLVVLVVNEGLTGFIIRLDLFDCRQSQKVKLNSYMWSSSGTRPGSSVLIKPDGFKGTVLLFI